MEFWKQQSANERRAQISIKIGSGEESEEERT